MVSSHAPPWITWSKVKCRMPSNFREEWWPHSEADRTACFQGIVTHTALHESMVKRIYGLCHLVLINSQNTTIASRPRQKNSRLKVILIMGTKRIEQRLLLPAGALCQLPCLKQKTKQSTYNQMTINQFSRRPYEIWMCVCVCVCIYIYAYIYIYTYVYTYIYIHTHTHIYIYVCRSGCVQVTLYLWVIGGTCGKKPACQCKRC